MDTAAGLDQAVVEITDGANGAGEPTAINTQDNSTVVGQDGNGLANELPPELKAKEAELMRAFHEKTQALAAEKERLAGDLNTYKQDATALYDLSKQPWFKDAVEAEKARRSGRVTELTPESFEAIKNDPRAMQEYLAKRDEATAASLKAQFSTELQRLGRNQQEMMTSREFDSVANKYGDEFIAANKANALKPYLDKNYDYETSFKLHMQDQGKVAGKKAPVNIDPAQRRAGTVEKPGMANAKGGPVYKPKNLNEALDRAFDLARRGVTDYRFEK